MRFHPLAIAAIVLLASCGKNSTDSETTVDSLALSYSVLKTLPHDPQAFTEGLTISDNKVLESTGQNGRSWVAEVDPGSGTHSKKIILDNQYFGEGMTVLNNKLYYLTYTTKIGFVYDAKSYKQIGEFKYNTQGWGLTHDNHNLIMSDGTDKLYYLDTTSLAVSKTLTVKANGAGLKNLNELEFANGFIYANVWETPYLVKINPANGKVVGRIDLSVLVDEIRRTFPEALELNGIAYDKNSKAFLITGKFWPKSYLIRIQ